MPDLRGVLIDRRSKRRVNHGKQPVLFPERCDFLEIHDAQGGISRRFQIKQFGVGADGPRVLLIIRGVDEAGLDAHLRQPLREKLVRAAINIALRDNVVAASEQGHDGGRDRAHA